MVVCGSHVHFSDMLVMCGGMLITCSGMLVTCGLILYVAHNENNFLIAINSCGTNGGKVSCDQICTNAIGSYYWSYFSGYSLSGNGTYKWVIASHVHVFRVNINLLTPGALLW